MDGGDLTETEQELNESVQDLWKTVYPGSGETYCKSEAMKAIVLYRVIRQCFVEAGWIISRKKIR